MKPVTTISVFASWQVPTRRSLTLQITLAFLTLMLTTSASYSADADSGGLGSFSIDSAIDTDFVNRSPWVCCVGTILATSGEMGPFLLEESGEGHSGVRPDIDQKDRDGLRRDSWYFLGSQVVTIGALYFMPESVSTWSDEDKSDYSLSTWRDNVRHPTIDRDDFFINYVLHPYWGATYFVRARERGYTEWESFWYSALLSTTYEFGAEALFEEPSIQDIIVTPVFGALLGDYFMRVRDGIRGRSAARGYQSRIEKWQWVLTDPLGAFNARLDRLFRSNVEFKVQPYLRSFRPARHPSIGGVKSEQDRVIGLQFHMSW